MADHRTGKRAAVDRPLPDALARFVERIHAFTLEIVRAQIKASAGKLEGMVIWGDVAYKKGMLFSPDYWRRVFKPGVKALVAECHAAGLPVIYHGCGNSKRIFEDFIEVGVDAYNPLETKAAIDVVELRRTYGHCIAFCGNMDVVLWANGNREELKVAVLTKLNAAKRRRVHLPVRSFGAQQRLGGRLRLCREACPRTRALSSAARRMRHSGPGVNHAH